MCCHTTDRIRFTNCATNLAHRHNLRAPKVASKNSVQPLASAWCITQILPYSKPIILLLWQRACRICDSGTTMVHCKEMNSFDQLAPVWISYLNRKLSCFLAVGRKNGSARFFTQSHDDPGPNDFDLSLQKIRAIVEPSCLNGGLQRSTF